MTLTPGTPLLGQCDCYIGSSFGMSCSICYLWSFATPRWDATIHLGCLDGTSFNVQWPVDCTSPIDLSSTTFIPPSTFGACSGGYPVSIHITE
jgi:hypothetical protein